MKRSAFPSASILIILLIALMALAAGCATPSVVATSDRLIGAPVYPPTNPATVQIIGSQPAGPCEELGEIHIEPVTGFPPRERIEEELRKEGARFGADTVLIIYDRTQASGALYMGSDLGPAEPMYGHAVRAEALKCKE